MTATAAALVDVVAAAVGVTSRGAMREVAVAAQFARLSGSLRGIAVTMTSKRYVAVGGQPVGLPISHALPPARPTLVAVECYRFDADPRELRISLRARIDAIRIDDPMATSLCHEARRVFLCNHAWFTALGPARYRDVARLTPAVLLP